MIKKCTCLLIITILFASLECFSFAIDANNSESEIKVLQLLGIIEGDTNKKLELDKAINRAELAALLTRAMGLKELAKQHYDEANKGTWPRIIIKDVKTNYWAYGYIVMAYGTRTLKGYEDGRFGPEDVVTYEQGITAIIKMLGYDIAVKSGKVKEKYVRDKTIYEIPQEEYTEKEINLFKIEPNGYIAMAQTLGLTYGVNTTIGKPLIKRDMLKLIYNSLMVGYMRGGDSCISGSIRVTKESFLTYALGLKEEIGIVSKNNVSAGEVEINGTNYKIGPTNVLDLVGQKVIYYFTIDESNNKKTLVIVQKVNTQD